MEFFRRASGSPERLGIFPGSFNPPTRAHLALASAALPHVEEVLFVLPRAFPHKTYEGAGFEERLGMLQAALEGEPRYSVAASDCGLFIEIALECREVYGPRARLAFICGADAAERVANWPYPSGSFEEMLGRFELLVASRRGDYCPPAQMRNRVHTLALPGDFHDVSATEVRRRLVSDEDWEHLVPDAVVPLARRIYIPNLPK